MGEIGIIATLCRLRAIVFIRNVALFEILFDKLLKRKPCVVRSKANCFVL